MITFGQRIKNFRKICDMSQLELAGKLGVSIQTVSKWECDTGMPDIIQIVPLAQVLGVTTDAILGVECDEQGYIDGVIKSFREKWEDKAILRYDTERLFDMFKTLKDILRRYPMNYLIAIECVRRGRSILRYTVHDHIKAPEGCDVNGVYRDIKKAAQSIIDYDTDLWRKAEAKVELIVCHYIMGNNEQAEAEFEGLPPEDKYYARIVSAEILEDREMQIDAAKKYYTLTLGGFEAGLWNLADAYSVCGKEKREEAKEILKKDIEIFERLEGFTDEVTRLSQLRRAWIYLGKQYLRDGDFEDVVDCAEKLTEVCEKHYKISKVPQSDAKYYDSSVVQIGMEIFNGWRDYATYLLLLYDECADRESNPVVTDPRFKACEERIAKLK